MTQGEEDVVRAVPTVGGKTRTQSASLQGGKTRLESAWIQGAR